MIEEQLCRERKVSDKDIPSLNLFFTHTTSTGHSHSHDMKTSGDFFLSTQMGRFHRSQKIESGLFYTTYYFFYNLVSRSSSHPRIARTRTSSNNKTTTHAHGRRATGKMTEEVVARPKTSGKNATPKELEEWARKKSPQSKTPPKPASSPPEPPAPEFEPEPAFQLRKGLPEDSPKAIARFVSSDRTFTGPLLRRRQRRKHTTLSFFKHTTL